MAPPEVSAPSRCRSPRRSALKSPASAARRTWTWSGPSARTSHRLHPRGLYHKDERYDVILDNVANHSLSDLRRALTPAGTLVPNRTVDNQWFAGAGRVISAHVLKRFVSHRLRPFLVAPKFEDLAILKKLIEAGKVTPVMDRTYPLSETPQAIGHVGGGHARGKVAITVPGQGA